MLTISELHSLLYGFEELADFELESIHPDDHPIFRVKLAPYLIGSALRNADPEEKYFHVEFYPPDKAEIWESKAWTDSLTRRLRLADRRGPPQQQRSFRMIGVLADAGAGSIRTRQVRALSASG